MPIPVKCGVKILRIIKVTYNQPESYENLYPYIAKILNPDWKYRRQYWWNLGYLKKKER